MVLNKILRFSLLNFILLVVTLLIYPTYTQLKTKDSNITSHRDVVENNLSTHTDKKTNLIKKDKNMTKQVTTTKNLKAEKFWKWFLKNEKKLYDEYNQNINDSQKVFIPIHKIKEHLHHFSNGLFIEIEQKENKLNLIVTPQGIRDYFADAFEIVLNAPKLTYWTIEATKPKSNLGEFSISYNNSNITIDNRNLFFQPIETLNNPNKTVIQIIFSAYNEDDPKKGTLQTTIYNILDETLGEISSSFDIDYIEFSNHANDDEEKLPISELENYLHKIKSNRKFYNQEFLPEDCVILKNEKKTSSIILNTNYRFYSFKNKYPYSVTANIVFDEQTLSEWPKGVGKILEIDEIIVDTFTKEKQSHWIYSHMDSKQRSIGFQCKDIEDVQGTINTLQEKIKTQKVEYEIKFDPFWLKSQDYLNHDRTPYPTKSS